MDNTDLSQAYSQSMARDAKRKADLLEARVARLEQRMQQIEFAVDKEKKDVLRGKGH